MATRNRGRNPFDRLRNHFDASDRTCPECGSENEDEGWESFTDGQAVTYQQVCSNCKNVRVRSVSLPR